MPTTRFGYFPAAKLIEVSSTGSLLGDNLAISSFKNLLDSAVTGMTGVSALTVKLAIFADDITGVGTTTFVIHRYADGQYSVDGYLSGAKFALAEFLTSSIALKAAATLYGGPITLGGAIAAGVGTTLLYSAMEFATESWFGLGTEKILHFFDKSANLASGIYYPDGLDGTVNQDENAVRDFIARAQTEIAEGGTISVDGANYTLYGTGTAFLNQLVAVSSAGTVNDFLLAGDGKNFHAHAFASTNPSPVKDYFFFKDNKVALDIPITVAGVKQLVTINNVYDGVANAAHLVMGDATNISATVNTKNLIFNVNPLLKTLTGGAGNDLILGGSGADTITGNAGNDIMLGGKGNDTFVSSANSGDNIMDGGIGVDTLKYSFNPFTISGVAIKEISSTVPPSTGVGDYIASIEKIIGSAGADNLSIALLQNSSVTTLNTGNGNDIVNFVTSSLFTNTPKGLTITLGTGDDTIVGSLGSDTYLFNQGDGKDTITENVQAGWTAATDTIKFTGTALTSANAVFNFSSVTPLTTLTFTGDASDQITIIGGTLGGGMGIENFIFSDGVTFGIAEIRANALVHAATAGNDTIIGFDNSDDAMFGGAGNDVMHALSGNDTLNGGAGADTMDGGLGVDTATYQDSAAAVTVNLALTTAQVGGTGDSLGDVLSNIENVTGSAFADNLTGSAANNVLEGGSGADKITGGVGLDTASYRSSAAAVTVSLALTTAQVSGGDASGDVLAGIENLTGSAFADTLTGGTGNNVINGGDGADKINGGAGIDTASYSTSSAGVTVNLALATAQVSGGDASGDVLSAIENLTGSAFADTLTGNAAANVIDGGLGNDTVTGGAGADVFVIGKDAGASDIITDFSTTTVGEKISLVGFVGSTAFSSLAISQVGADAVVALEDGQSLTLKNVLASSLTAASFGQTTGAIDGTAGNDILNGTANADIMHGLAGNDILNGSAGADTMDGGTGIDTVDYSASAALVNVDLTLATGQTGGDAAGDILIGIENLTGSAFNDVLTGDALANILSGGAGNDKLVGGVGADILDGGAGSDVASYAGSAVGVTIDLNLATAQVSAGDASGDVLTGIENLLGSSFNDTFILSAAPNIIDGGAGNDTVSYAKSAAVQVDLSAFLQIGGAAVGDVLQGIENLTGSAFADSLTGDFNANILSGGSGKDTLTGGLGADKFAYSAVTDSGSAAGARDIITDFVEGTDKVDLSAFAGTFNFNGTGALSTGGIHSVDYAQVGGNTIVNVDADGNGVLDFQIELTGLHTLAAGDFLL